MSRSFRLRVHDILQAIDRCQRYVVVFDSEDQNLTEMALGAVERNLQIIGEAANHLPAELTEALPEIAWSQIRGLRTILVHQYIDVDSATILDVVQNYLPELADALNRYFTSK